MIEYVIFSGYLLIAGVSDLRSRTVSLRFMQGCAAAGVILCTLRCICRPSDATDILFPRLAGAAYGGLFLLLGFVTREAIGYADGWSILLAGLYLGLSACVLISCVALLLSALFSILLLVFHRAGRNSSYPFLPFLGAAYLLWITAAAL